MIQSAKELAHGVAKSVSDAIHTPIVLDIYGEAVDLIRARDREIIEACVEMITDNIGMDGRIGLTESTVLLNAVLREIS
jgi:hypothetical protein